MAQTGKTLREKITRRINRTQIPFIVYAAVFISMFLLWRFRSYHEELAMDFFAELFGAAFTLFIIDVLLVRTKSRRWKEVREELNYLIARNVNRIRDGISTRVFNFNPELDPSLSEEQYLEELRIRRTDFLNQVVTLDEDQLLEKIDEAGLFSDEAYDYFNEKADEVWSILNIKYSDYFHPDLVSHLISLNLNLKDLCSHIRQYMKGSRFTARGEVYENIGRRGALVSLTQIIDRLNTLKNEGFSEVASLQLVDEDE